MACVPVSTEELSNCHLSPNWMLCHSWTTYIRAFIFMYCSRDGNFGIINSLKILTSISFTPDTLLALNKCLRPVLHVYEHMGGLSFGFSSLYWLGPAGNISDKILRDRLLVHNIRTSFSKRRNGDTFFKTFIPSGVPDH